MSFNAPPQIAVEAIRSGISKAAATPPKALVGGFLAGAYIAFGSLLAIVVTSGLDPKTWVG